MKRKLYNEVIIITNGIKAENAINYIRDKPRYKQIIIYCDDAQKYAHLKEQNPDTIYAVSDNYKSLS